MNTYTGRVLYPSNFGVPAPLDLAVQLGRIPRFAGATRLWPWTVMHHLLAGMALITRMRERSHILSHNPDAHMLGWLLHEADEVATGDTPTTWKGREQRDACDKLNRRVARLYASVLVEELVTEQGGYVKYIDELMLVAEMMEVAHPNCLDVSGYSSMARLMSKDDLLMARSAVRTTRVEYFKCDDTGTPDAPGSVAYLEALANYGANLHYFTKEEGGTGG